MPRSAARVRVRVRFRGLLEVSGSAATNTAVATVSPAAFVPVVVTVFSLIKSTKHLSVTVSVPAYLSLDCALPRLRHCVSAPFNVEAYSS